MLGISVTVFIIGTAVYPYINKTTFDDDYSHDIKTALDPRDDLKEVVYASTICSTFWRTNLFDMWENKTHDYKNDPIYQECREMLDAKNRCLGNDHIWNQNGTCTLTSIYPGGSGMGFKYGKYVSGTLLENEN